MPDVHETTPAPPALCDLVSLWPGAGEEARAALEQRWLSLSVADRAAALARAPSVLRAFTVSGRRRLFSLSTYLAGRNWREFDSRPMPALGDREKHAQHAAMSWAWRQRLAPSEHLVLLALCDRFRPGLGAWPTQAILAEACRLSRPTVAAALRRLEAKGLIRRGRRAAKPSLYRLACEGEAAGFPLRAA